MKIKILPCYSIKICVWFKQLIKKSGVLLPNLAFWIYFVNKIWDLSDRKAASPFCAGLRTSASSLFPAWEHSGEELPGWWTCVSSLRRISEKEAVKKSSELPDWHAAAEPPVGLLIFLCERRSDPARPHRLLTENEKSSLRIRLHQDVLCRAESAKTADFGSNFIRQSRECPNF